MTHGCCDMMKMVIARARPDDRLGLMVETLFRVRDGKPRETVVIRFRKAPKTDVSVFSRATLAEINYCPWCGKRSRGPGKMTTGLSRTRRTP